MADIHGQLLTRLDTFARNNPGYFETVSQIKNSGYNQDIEWLQNFQCYERPEIMNYRDYLILTKYLDISPSGIKHCGVYYNLATAICYLPQEMTEGISYFNNIYIAAINKEMIDADINSLATWIHIYSELKKYPQLNLQEFNESLSLKVTCRMWDIIDGLTEVFEKDWLLFYINVLVDAINADLDVKSTVNSLLISLDIFLSQRFKIDDPSTQKKIDEESIRAQLLVAKLRLMKFIDNEIKALIDRLEDFFGIYIEETEVDDRVFERPDIPYVQLNFNDYTYERDIYLNAKNPKFDIKISIMKRNSDGTLIAVKEYSAKQSINDISNVKNEIDILETLSAYSTPENCLMKYYGCLMGNPKIYFAMDYHQKTLMDTITEMKQSGQSFNDDSMKIYTNNLLDAFAFLEEKGIYHQDIKPHNILVTENWYLKIIDFSISLQKQEKDIGVTQTGLFPIQGTQGYMAPELEHNRKEPKNQLKFRRGKADVFSLGITLLQMYTLEELHTLNLFENNKRLIAKVTSVKIEWLQTLLSKMLNENYRLRPSFKDCLQYVPSEARHSTITV